MRSRFAVPATVGILIAIVAVATRTEATGSVPSADVSGPTAPAGLVYGLIGAGAALVALALAATVKRMPGRVRVPRQAWRRTARLAAAALGVAALLLLGRVVTGGLERPPLPEMEEPSGTSVPNPVGRPSPLSDPSGSVALLAAASAAAAALVAVVYLRRRQDPTTDLKEQLAAALQRGIDDLRSSPDPRAAVISSYARLESVLEARAHGRYPQETTVEYVSRILGATELPAQPIMRLGRLYERARFAPAAVDRAMQLEAIDALVVVRDAVRAEVPELPVTARGSTP